MDVLRIRCNKAEKKVVKKDRGEGKIKRDNKLVWTTPVDKRFGGWVSYRYTQTQTLVSQEWGLKRRSHTCLFSRDT